MGKSTSVNMSSNVNNSSPYQSHQDNFVCYYSNEALPVGRSPLVISTESNSISLVLLILFCLLFYNIESVDVMPYSVYVMLSRGNATNRA